MQRNVIATGAAPCLGKEPSPDDVQRHLDAQLAPQQRQQHVLRVPHRRRHRRVGAAAQCQDRLDALHRHMCAVLRLAVRRGAAMAGEEQTWQGRLSFEALNVLLSKRDRHHVLTIRSHLSMMGKQWVERTELGKALMMKRFVALGATSFRMVSDGDDCGRRSCLCQQHAGASGARVGGAEAAGQGARHEAHGGRPRCTSQQLAAT